VKRVLPHRKKARALRIITGAIILQASLLVATARLDAQVAPLPLDPLTPQERELAETIARAHPTVREFVGAGRSRQINVGFIAVKLAGEKDRQSDVPTRRHAEVLFYNYDRDQGLRALVDLTGRRVSDVVRVPGQSVSINGDEVALAARLALADPRVIRLFGDRMPPFRAATRPAARNELQLPRIEGLRTVGSPRGDPCYRHRCVVMFFRVNNRYVHINRVTVDLTTQRVLVREGER
jgi:hypothetical protein